MNEVKGAQDYMWLLNPHEKGLPKECGLPLLNYKSREWLEETCPNPAWFFFFCPHDLRWEQNMCFISLIWIPIKTLDAFAINNIRMSAFWHFSRSAEELFLLQLFHYNFILSRFGQSKYIFNYFSFINSQNSILVTLTVTGHITLWTRMRCIKVFSLHPSIYALM